MLRGIHKLCDKSLWDELQNLLHEDTQDGETARETVSHTGGYGEWTPLHLACKRNAPSDVVKSLCDLSPVPAETFDLYTKLPIHYAVEVGASIDVLRILLKTCPESITGIDGNGRTPLHSSIMFATQGPADLNDQVRKFPTAEEIELLLDSENSVIWTADEDGFIPLHYAACNVKECNIDSLRMLINVDVTTVIAQDDNGMTALHLALMNSNEQVISQDYVQALLGLSLNGENLVGENYDVSRMLDNGDKLPIHCACHNFEMIPIEIFRLLLERCPTGASTECNEGGYPLEIIEKNRPNSDSPLELTDFNAKSDLIFAYYPDIEYFRTEEERLDRIAALIIEEMEGTEKELSDVAQSLWIWMCTFPDREDPKLQYPKTVRAILDSITNKQSKKFLACIETVTEDGTSLPLHELANFSCREMLMPYLRFVDRYEILKGEQNILKSKTSIIIRAVDTAMETSKIWETVQIKFFFHKEMFQKEADLHNIINEASSKSDLAHPVCPMIEFFDLDRIGTPEESPQDIKFSRDLAQIDDALPIDMRQAIIFAECNFRDISTESDDEAPSKRNEFRIKENLLSIAKCIGVFHAINLSTGQVDAGDFLKRDEEITVLQNIESVVPFHNYEEKDSQTNFHGDVSLLKTRWSLQPEMIAELSDDEMKMYMKYWNHVAYDAHTASNLTLEDFVKKSDKLNGYINSDESDLEAFSERINKNFQLWQNIKPRQVGDKYYVIKCFERDIDGNPRAPEDLPYELVEKALSLDIWNFGCIIFEILTNETLFHADSKGNIVEDSNFKDLFEWTSNSEFACKRISKVTDPLGRDLLRSLLDYPMSQRQPKIGTVIEHPFFCSDVDQVQEFISEILDEEASIQERKRIVREQQEEREKIIEEINSRTDELECVSSQMMLKFEDAMWGQVPWDLKSEDISYPMSCILLPYRLDFKNNGLTVPSSMVATGSKIGLLVANILYYNSIVNEVEKNWEYISRDSSNFCDPFLMQQMDASDADMSIVSICKLILERKTKATEYLKQIIGRYTNEALAGDCAEKLVNDTLQEYVDIEICQSFVKKAESTRKTLSSLLEDGNNTDKIAHEFIARQLSNIIGPNFSICSSKTFETIEVIIKDMMTRFKNDCFLSLIELLEENVAELIEIYENRGEGYLYLVDETTGVPVTSNMYPLHFNFGKDLVSTLLPLSIMCLRTKYPIGLQSVLGFEAESIPSEWSNLKYSSFNPHGNNEPLDLQFNTLQKSLESHSACVNIDHDVNSVSSLKDVLLHFRDLLREQDPNNDFAGLRRLKSPCNKILWAGSHAKVKAIESARAELEMLRQSKSGSDQMQLEKKVKKDMPIEEKSNPKLNELWNTFIKFSPTSIDESQICEPPAVHYESNATKYVTGGAIERRSDLIESNETHMAGNKHCVVQKLSSPMKMAAKTPLTAETSEVLDLRNNFSPDKNRVSKKVVDVQVGKQVNEELGLGMSKLSRDQFSPDKNRVSKKVVDVQVEKQVNEELGLGISKLSVVDDDDISIMSGTTLSSANRKSSTSRNSRKTLSEIRQVRVEKNVRHPSPMTVRRMPSKAAAPSPLRSRPTQPSSVLNRSPHTANKPMLQKKTGGGIRTTTAMRTQNSPFNSNVTNNLNILSSRSDEENLIQFRNKARSVR